MGYSEIFLSSGPRRNTLRSDVEPDIVQSNNAPSKSDSRLQLPNEERERLIRLQTIKRTQRLFEKDKQKQLAEETEKKRVLKQRKLRMLEGAKYIRNATYELPIAQAKTISAGVSKKKNVKHRYGHACYSGSQTNYCAECFEAGRSNQGVKLPRIRGASSRATPYLNNLCKQDSGHIVKGGLRNQLSSRGTTNICSDSGNTRQEIKNNQNRCKNSTVAMWNDGKRIISNEVDESSYNLKISSGHSNDLNRTDNFSDESSRNKITRKEFILHQSNGDRTERCLSEFQRQSECFKECREYIKSVREQLETDKTLQFNNINININYAQKNNLLTNLPPLNVSDDYKLDSFAFFNEEQQNKENVNDNPQAISFSDEFGQHEKQGTRSSFAKPDFNLRKLKKDELIEQQKQLAELRRREYAEIIKMENKQKAEDKAKRERDLLQSEQDLVSSLRTIDRQLTHIKSLFPNNEEILSRRVSSELPSLTCVTNSGQQRVRSRWDNIGRSNCGIR